MGSYQHHEARTSLLDGQKKVNGLNYPSRALHSGHQQSKLRRSDMSYNGYAQQAGGASTRYGGTSGESPYQSFFRYKPSSSWQWLLIGLTSLQLLVCVGLESYIFAKFNQEIAEAARRPDGAQIETKAITVFLTIFIFGFVYQVPLVWDALRSRNTIQTFGICIYNFALMIYSAIQPDQINKALISLGSRGYLLTDRAQLYARLRPYFISIPVIIAVFSLVMCFVAWKLYQEFAWVIYKHISADLKMKNRYLQYQIYITLLKFDFFFFLGFAIQFIVLVLKTNDSEFPLSIAAVPFTLFFLVMAAFVTRHESVIGMVIVIILYLAASAYYIFKLVRIYQPNANSINYGSVKKSLAVFAILAILLVVVTIIYAIICTINFNKGLKPHIQRKGKKTTPMGFGGDVGMNGMARQQTHQGYGDGFGGYGGGYAPGYGEMGKLPGVQPAPQRMTID